MSGSFESESAGSEPDTVFGMFMAASRAAGTRPFLAVPSSQHRDYLPEGAEFTYSQAMTQVQEVVTRYRQAGYGPGHRVALVLANRPEYFWHFLALNALGACAVPLNPEYLRHEFTYALTIVDACLVVVCGGPVDVVAQAATDAGVPCLVLPGDGGRYPSAVRSPPPVSPLDRDRAALIIFTSGSTSRPKGCLITNLSCLASGKSYADVGGLMRLQLEAERLYVPLPMFHMNATVLALNAMLRQRSCLISTDRFRASTWWQEIRESRATCIHYLGLIPPILLKASPDPDERVTTVRFGVGAAVDPGLHALFETRFGFPLIEVWGMTETSRLIANAHEPRQIHTRAFGKPHAPLEVLVVNEDDRPVRHGEPGEFLVRCAGLDPRAGFFSGYVNDENATEAAWRGGWFHTGDIVTQDADGMLYFVERRKNIIRRSGENIAAAEVEETLIADPAVSGVVVLAVPDSLREEEPLACVVLAPHVAPNADQARALIETARPRLAAHKLPGWIQFIRSIPVTPTHKVRKDALLDGFSADSPDVYDMRPVKTQRNKPK